MHIRRCRSPTYHPQCDKHLFLWRSGSTPAYHWISGVWVKVWRFHSLVWSIALDSLLNCRPNSYACPSSGYRTWPIVCCPWCASCSTLVQPLTSQASSAALLSSLTSRSATTEGAMGSSSKAAVLNLWAATPLGLNIRDSHYHSQQ